MNALGFAWRLLALSIPVLLTACTTVSITEQGGTTRIERHFGWISIELSPSTQAIVAEIRSLGYIASPMGTTMGLEQSTFAALPMDCRLVVWIENQEQTEALRLALGNRQDLCVIKEPVKEKP